MPHTKSTTESSISTGINSNTIFDVSLERKAQRQRIRDLEKQNQKLSQENAILHERMAAMEDVLYRQSRRGLGRAIPMMDAPGQTSLFGDETPESEPDAEDDETTEPEVPDESPTTATSGATPQKTGAKKRGGRLNIPDHLERETIDLGVDPDVQRAIDAGATVEAMDPVVTERLDYIPGKYIVKRYERPRYRIIDNGFNYRITTPAPKAVVTDGQVEDGLLIDLAIANAKEFLPTYRFEERCRSYGLDIPRCTLSRWLIRFGEFLEPIADATAIALMDRDIVHFDDTPFFTLVDGDGNRTPGERHIGRFWSLAGDDEAWFQYTPTREGHWVTTLLNDFRGTIVMDDYSGHKRLLTDHPDDIRAAHCWAHVLRKFRDAADQRGQTIINHIQQIYALRGPPGESPPLDFAQMVKPHLQIIRQEIQRYFPEAPPRTAFGKALRYTNRLWHGLTLFQDDPRIPLDNNPVERGMRPVALRRKNSLFAASEAGAHAAAVLATIFESAKRCHLNPRTYLTELVKDMHGGRNDWLNMRPAAMGKNQSSSVA